MVHKCIKPVCSNTYESDDTEAYYCPDCVEDNRKIAKVIDAKLKSKPSRKAPSLVDEYDKLPKGKFGYPMWRG